MFVLTFRVYRRIDVPRLLASIFRPDIIGDLSRREDTASSPSFPENIGIRDSVLGERDRSPFGVNNFPLESAIRRGKGMYVWSRSGRKIRWNLACRVNIDIILAKWHDPHGCTIEIRISRIKRALEGNDIACAITGRFYRGAGMYTAYLGFLELLFYSQIFRKWLRVKRNF